jgi:hypothetical protein
LFDATAVAALRHSRCWCISDRSSLCRAMMNNRERREMSESEESEGSFKCRCSSFATFVSFAVIFSTPDFRGATPVRPLPVRSSQSVRSKLPLGSAASHQQRSRVLESCGHCVLYRFIEVVRPECALRVPEMRRINDDSRLVDSSPCRL